MATDSNYYGGTDAPLSVTQLKGGAPNVTGGERWLSILAGGALAAVGVKRGGVIGTLALVGGAALTARGIGGMDPVKRAFTSSPAEQKIAQEEGWSSAATGGFKVGIGKPAEEIYDFLLTLSNYPRFMDNLKSVEDLGDGRSRWTVDGGDSEFSYTSRIVEARRPEYYAWESEPGAEFKTRGEITLKAGGEGRGTEVGMVVAYEPRMGQLSRVYDKLRRHETAITTRKNLKRLKMLLETGEIATAKAHPTASNAA